MNSLTQLQWGSWQIGGPRHYYRESRIMKAIRSVLPGGRILDAGCGTGSLIIQLVLRGYEVCGIDMSEDSVRRTDELLRQFAPNAKSVIKEGSAEHIDFPDRYFDTVVAAEVLEHVEDDSLAVQEFYRVLKRGGACVITVPANPLLWDISDEMAGHKRRYSKDDLLLLFNSANFQVERLIFMGFPLMRLYHHFVFLRWARHIDKRVNMTISDDTATRIGLNRWTTLILGNLFRIDNIFDSLPWGTGILLVAKKV